MVVEFAWQQSRILLCLQISCIQFRVKVHDFCIELVVKSQIAGMAEAGQRNGLDRFVSSLIDLLDKPVTWFRETIVVPNQKHYPYYHQKYQRVATIDECYEHEPLCMFEANEQFKRDRDVDGAIVNILRERMVECYRYEGHERHEYCKKITEDYEEGALNYFIKYGDLGAYAHAKTAYMKQKHRMVYERRKEAGTWNPNHE